MTIAQAPYSSTPFWVAVTDSRADYGLAGKDLNISRGALSLLAQDLLTCIAPFVSVIATGAGGRNLFSRYLSRLKHQPELSHLPIDSLEQVFLQGITRGLLLPHPEVFGFFYINPVFSDFLKTFRNTSGREETVRGVGRAFAEHYSELGAYMAELALSDQPRKRRLGHCIIRLEYENLITAMNLALDEKKSVLNICAAIFAHPDRRNEQTETEKTISEKLITYSDEELSGQTGADFVVVMNRIAARQMEYGQYANAEKSFRTLLSLLAKLTILDERQKARLRFPVLCNLGKAASKQRHWQQAEEYLREALSVGMEFGNRYEQSLILHRLGVAATEQQHWSSAQEYFFQALGRFIIGNDFQAQALVLKNLFRVWKGSGEGAELPKALADILGWSAESVENMFRKQGRVL
jgi:tetratricopeptide (TPR) repeat protein